MNIIKKLEMKLNEKDTKQSTKKYTISFEVYSTGAVSLDNIRYGPSTMVAKALTEIANKKK